MREVRNHYEWSSIHCQVGTFSDWGTDLFYSHLILNTRTCKAIRVFLCIFLKRV